MRWKVPCEAEVFESPVGVGVGVGVEAAPVAVRRDSISTINRSRCRLLLIPNSLSSSCPKRRAVRPSTPFRAKAEQYCAYGGAMERSHCSTSATFHSIIGLVGAAGSAGQKEEEAEEAAGGEEAETGGTDAVTWGAEKEAKAAAEDEREEAQEAKEGAGMEAEAADEEEEKEEDDSTAESGTGDRWRRADEALVRGLTEENEGEEGE
jgi:hypothetical protein